MMINTTIKADVSGNATTVKPTRKPVRASSTRQQSVESCLQTVESGYVLSEPAIRGIKHEQVSHRRRIL